MSGGGGGDIEDTEEQKALAEVAAKRFNRYKEIFVPLENEYISDVLDVRDQGTYETVGGLASSGYQKDFQRGQDQIESELIQQGADPTSGVFVGNSKALRKAQAIKQGLGVSAAKSANTDRFYDGVKSIVAMGQGQASDAIGGLQSLAASSAEKATSDAGSAFTSASGMRAGIGAVAGMAASPFVDKALKSPAGGV